MIKEINTNYNSFELFSIFKDEEYVFFLDSGMEYNGMGRYSFIGTTPFLTLSAKHEKIKIKKNCTETIITGNSFDVLKQLLSEYKIKNDTDFPFIGGAVGYLGYELYHQIEEINSKTIDDVNIPDMFFGFYDTVIIIDNLENKKYISSIFNEKNKLLNIENKIINYKHSKEKTTHKNEVEFLSNFSKLNYIKAIEKIKEYIKNGDVYQVNMTQRFECKLNKTPFELYEKLRTINPAPFAAYFDIKEAQIVSSSPERFIKIKDRRIETRPIKGTMPRGKNPKEDNNNRLKLINSEKDHAELLMIVDLERNDLGKVSKTGTVKVPELFKLEEYATVFHLVSTITGEMKENISVVDVLKSTFPGGSITGAPKIRAIEIIDELEPTTRNIYTGSIGYIGFDESSDFNIAIRTILCKKDKAYFQVGGGITWDSNSESEYQESLDKGKALMEALK